MRTNNTEYHNRIISILENVKYGTPERIKKEYIKIYLKPINWITIKRHLEILFKEGIIEKIIISEGKRDIIIYKTKSV